jgi:hypothetical protein
VGVDPAISLPDRHRGGARADQPAGAGARSRFYAVMVSPLLTPGVAIGIATLVLWRQVGVGGGTFADRRRAVELHHPPM